MPRLTDEQLASRSEGLGASDVVEALGLAPWEGAGPMRLWLEKTAADTPPRESTEWLEWGHTMEPVLLAWYERARGVTLLPGGHVPHRSLPWLWATLDGYVTGEGRIVEAKNVGSAHAAEWDAAAEDGVPRYVRAQVVVGQACHGARLTDVVASIAGRPPHVWTVAYDEELAELLLGAAARFWGMVKSRRPPPLDATEATKAMLRRRYPGNEDRVILPASYELDDVAARRMAAMVEKMKAETQIDLADAELLQAIGDADGIAGQDGSWKMTWRRDKSGKRRQRFTSRG